MHQVSTATCSPKQPFPKLVSSRFAGISLRPSLLILLSFPLLLSGCGLSWAENWIVIAIFAALGLILILIGGALIADDEGGMGCFILIVALLFCFVAYVSYRGMQLNEDAQARMEFEAAAAAYQQQIADQQKEQAAAQKASPAFHVKQTKEKLSEVKKRTEEKLVPLQKQYSQELNGYRRQLKDDLARLPAVSYEEMVRDRAKYLEQLNLMERASLLQYNLDWLYREIEASRVSTLELDQAAWKFEKLQEMSEVADEAQMEELRRAILTANEILERDVPTPEKQDLARLQAQLFEELR